MKSSVKNSITTYQEINQTSVEIGASGFPI